MTVRELITLLGQFDGEKEVVGISDEFSTYHDLQPPRPICLVKGNMFMSYNGSHWVEDDGHLGTIDDSPVRITDAKEAVRIW